MKKIYLSAKSFNSLKRDPKGSKVQRVWTHEFLGLGISLGENKKSIIYKYKSPVTNKFRIITLDSYSYSQKLDEDLIDRIVGDHYKIKDKIRADIDPLEIKSNIRAELQKKELAKQKAKEESEKRKYTLNNAFDDYTKHRSFADLLKPRSQATYISCYNKHIAPILGNRPLVNIHPKKDVNVFLDSLPDSACHMSTAVLQRIQTTAIHLGRLEQPFCFMQQPRIFSVRDSFIEDLPAFISYLQDNKKYRSYKNGLMAQLLYACRSNEIYSLQWDEVDFDNQMINIPWERVKNRSIKKKMFHPLQLPIMPAMLAILEQQKGASDTYVFPQLLNDACMTNPNAYHQLKSDGFLFSPHDIRRTVSSTLEDMDGVTIEDVDIVLDHVIQGVNKAYLKRKNLLERKRHILHKWHTYLLSLMQQDISPIKEVSVQ